MCWTVEEDTVYSKLQKVDLAWQVRDVIQLKCVLFYFIFKHLKQFQQLFLSFEYEYEYKPVVSSRYSIPVSVSVHDLQYVFPPNEGSLDQRRVAKFVLFDI